MKFSTSITHHKANANGLTHVPSVFHISYLKQAIAHIWQAVQPYLIDQARFQVWQTHDAEGNLVWNAVDPTTHRAIYGATEAEIRVWVEYHYHDAPVGVGDRPQQCSF